MQKSYDRCGYEWVASQRKEGLSLSSALLREMIPEEGYRLDALFERSEGKARARLQLSRDYERLGELLWGQGAYREAWVFLFRALDCSIPSKQMRGVERFQLRRRFDELERHISERLAIYKRLPHACRSHLS